MTDLDELNDFLIRAANLKKVGIRRKIVLIEKWIKSFRKRKIDRSMLPGYVYCPDIPEVFKNMSDEERKKLLDHLKSLNAKGPFKLKYAREIKIPKA